MQEFSTIEKDPKLEISQDFEQLREAGLKHIEALGSELWTDYNSHDPGITLLEVLAYAITDLGYRTGNDIKDILTEGSDELNNHNETFHKATQILPCNQVTELDLREIIIDVVGVRNVWIKIADSFENTYVVNYDDSLLDTEELDPAVTKEEIETLNGLYHVVVEFDRLAIPIDAVDRINLQKQVLGEVKQRLSQYRNFCEDYFVDVRSDAMSETPVTQIVTKPLSFENIVVWADVEVEPDADMEKVHAQIYFDIEQFLIPYVTFYSLKERLDSGQTIDEIFEGPLLENGFINEDELAKIELLETIHTSDLYQVMMDVTGVKAVKSMKVANYLSKDYLVGSGFLLSADQTNNDLSWLDSADIQTTGDLDLKKLLLVKGQEWTLDLNSNNDDCIFYELVLDTVTTDLEAKINKTIKFYTGDNSVPVTLDTSRTLDELNILRQNDRKRRERLGQTSFELEVPVGEHLDLSVYYPAQNDLPEVYGTGDAGLAEEVSEERKAQAKQLKGFLLLFEQILTNYLAQLNNVRHLFSWDDTIDKTYYTQVLNDIKNRDELYLEQYDGSDLSPLSVLDEARMAELVQDDAESATEYYDRRSRFLNHLIARFNEKFVDYTMAMHSMGLKDRVISDKTNFLKDYDLISMNRGKGFNYAQMRMVRDTIAPDALQEPDVWDTTNITGYQNRLCGFLGISDETRRFLYSGHEVRIEAFDDGGTMKYRYILLIDAETGLEIFGTAQTTDTDAIQQFDDLIESEGKENIDDDITDPLQFKLIDSDLLIQLGEGSLYATAGESTDALLAVNDYFDNVVSFTTTVSGSGSDWNFSIEISDASPTFNVEGLGFTTELDAIAGLEAFLDHLKADNLAFSMPSLGDVVDNKYFFNVSLIDAGTDIAISEELAFVNSEPAADQGRMIAESFLNQSIGYVNSESGLHVVEHILLRPRTDNMIHFDVDVKQYDSIDTAKNPPVAYPVDYNGVYDLALTDDIYNNQYFLSSEVELTSPSLGNKNGKRVTIVERFFYTLTEDQNTEEIGSGVLWSDLISQLQIEHGTSKYILRDNSDLSDEQNALIWSDLVESGFGCEYENFIFGTSIVDGKTVHYYFITDNTNELQGDILGGLAIVQPSEISVEEIKERALRAFAYFCDNTTCKGIANPYEFKATVVLPAWTTRAKEYNYREYAEEIIRLEAPAHVAVDIFWLNRSQMREFELCYREWLLRQGEFLYLDRLIKQGALLVPDILSVPVIETIDTGGYVADITGTPLIAATNLSNSMLLMNAGANCLIEKINGLINVYQSIYESLIRNDQYFTSSGNGSILAWISDAADDSIVNRAELIGGSDALPPFLGFYNGEDMEYTTPPVDATPGTFDAGDFVVLNYNTVVPGTWTFSVKTYSDSGQVSCADVTITILQDLEAEYENIAACYSSLSIGTIVSDIHDDNGLVSSAAIFSGTLPSGLKLITDSGDLALWGAGLGLTPAEYEALYQPGDIVVDGPVAFPVNDGLALASEGNLVPNLIIDVVDITGGSTSLIWASSDQSHSGGLEPIIHIYGNAGVIASPCEALNLGLHNLANTVYTTGLTDVLMTLKDGHYIEGVYYVDGTAAFTAPADSGISIRVNVDGEVEIFVENFALFEIFVNNEPTNSDGIVEIGFTGVTMTDSCGFEDTWGGNICVIPDREPIVVMNDTITCAGSLTNTTLITITDEDNAVSSYTLTAAVEADLAVIGVDYNIESSSPGILRFRVINSSAFLTAIQTESNFSGIEIIIGVETLYYEFDIDIVDGYGGQSTITVRLYAPVNKPFECVEAYPSGTSYQAYLNSSKQWDIYGYNYAKTYQNTGKTVMSFNDDNGIKSISCSCKKCNGQPFWAQVVDDYTKGGVLDFKVESSYEYGTEVFLVDPPSTSKNSPDNPIQAKKGTKEKGNAPIQTEKGDKMSSNPNVTKEKLVGRGIKRPGISPVPTCTCLTNKGLALDKVNNRIYVENSSLFQQYGVGTHRFSITVTDNCGITSCKNIILVIGPDNPAVYVDVKNKSYLNALSNGDVIGYPVDPDGDIAKAEIVLYNKTSGVTSLPSSPSSWLPPGMRFNKFTGEIRVNNASSGTGPFYVTDSKSKQRATASDTSRSRRSERRTIFKRKGSTSESNGIASRNASSGLPTKGVNTNDTAQFPVSIVSPATWITAPGSIEIGTWTIHVLTTDIFGGLTVIEYKIIIKKSAVLGGVSVTTDFTDFNGVKTAMKENYGDILKAPIEITTTQAETNVSMGSETVITNKAQ